MTMTDQWTNRLSEYLDGELPPGERAELEVHLGSCASCLEVLSELRAVIARAAILPDAEPAADLWPGVRAGMEAKQVVKLESRRAARRFSFSLSQLVAAAATLVLVSGGSAWWVTHRNVPVAATHLTPAPVKAQPVVWDRRGRSDEAVTELERVLQSERGKLDSTTIRVLTQNLALIDRAIDQARKALDADPNNAYLNDHLARTMRKKIEVLRRAANLASQS
jgi:anti-sigma factor RsiW